METKTIDFFVWMRKIEFKRLKKYYLKYYKQENKIELDLIEKYLNLDFKEYKAQDFEKIINIFRNETRFNQIEQKIAKNQENLLTKEEAGISKIYDTLNFIKDYLDSLSNEKYNKIRKHKIIYFMFSYAIYMNKEFKIWNNINNVFDSFLFKRIDNKEAKFCAFENGPILYNIYQSKRTNNGIDDNFKFSVNDERKLLIFELAYFYLKDFSTLQLIKESHETSPWKNNYKKDKYFAEIKNEEIINYFKKEKPFFLKLLDN